jgi:probable rRNA maturation factor
MHNAQDQRESPTATGHSPDHEDPGSSSKGDVPSSLAHHPDTPTNHIELEASLLSDALATTLYEALAAALSHLPRTLSRVGVQVVNDASMISLHMQWHNLDTTTDVLTFESDTDGQIEVDIAICLDEAIRQATARSHEPIDELVLYALHGLLHCCGHNDQTPQSQASMFTAQDHLLRAIGRSPISEDK